MKNFLLYPRGGEQTLPDPTGIIRYAVCKEPTVTAVGFAVSCNCEVYSDHLNKVEDFESILQDGLIWPLLLFVG